MFLKGEWLLKGDGSLKEMGPEFSPQSPGLRKAQSRSVSMEEADKDLWGSLVNKPYLMRELQANQKFCFKPTVRSSIAR